MGIESSSFCIAICALLFFSKRAELHLGWTRGDHQPMSAPLVVSIPHSLGREEAMRRLKDGLSRTASSVPVLKVDEERWEDNRMIFRVRALGQAAAGHVDVADDHVTGGGHAAVAAAALCPSRAGRDPQSRQSAADETQLMHCNQLCLAATKNPAWQIFVSLSVTNLPEHRCKRGRREPTFVVGTTTARPSGRRSRAASARFTEGWRRERPCPPASACRWVSP